MSEMKCLSCGRVGIYQGPYLYRDRNKWVAVCTCGWLADWVWEGEGNGESKPKKQGTGRQKKSRS